MGQRIILSRSAAKAAGLRGKESRSKIETVFSTIINDQAPDDEQHGLMESSFFTRKRRHIFFRGPGQLSDARAGWTFAGLIVVRV